MEICLQHFEMTSKQSGERVRQHLDLQPSKNQDYINLSKA